MIIKFGKIDELLSLPYVEFDDIGLIKPNEYTYFEDCFWGNELKAECQYSININEIIYPLDLVLKFKNVELNFAYFEQMEDLKSCMDNIRDYLEKRGYENICFTLNLLERDYGEEVGEDEWFCQDDILAKYKMVIALNFVKNITGVDLECVKQLCDKNRDIRNALVLQKDDKERQEYERLRKKYGNQ